VREGEISFCGDLIRQKRELNESQEEATPYVDFFRS